MRESLAVLFVGYVLAGVGVLWQARQVPPVSLVIFIVTWFALLTVGLVAVALERMARPSNTVRTSRVPVAERRTSNVIRDT